MTDYEILSQRISDLCEDYEIEQKELSEYCISHGVKCSEATISDIVKGQKDKGYNYKIIKCIAEKFNVSTDYLLGLASEKIALDTEEGRKISEICEYTGLSDRAVEALHGLLQTGNYNYNCAVSEIIESVQAEFDSIILGYGNTEKSIFTCLVQYLETDFLNNAKVLDIALSGNLIDMMNTDRKVSNEINTDFRNIISIGEVETRTVIEQVLLNSVIEKLKDFKRNCDFSKSFSFEAFNKTDDNQDFNSDEDIPF